MKYDLSDKQDRKRFVARCNALLKKQRTNIELLDESNRTLNQNSYLHVICRILAIETGVTEKYVKDIYFKQLANPDIFITTSTDPISGTEIQYLRSTASLTTEEMNKAINTFRHWSEDNGYYLPEANPSDDGTYIFATEQDAAAFHKAEIEASKFEQYI